MKAHLTFTFILVTTAATLTSCGDKELVDQRIAAGRSNAEQSARSGKVSPTVNKKDSAGSTSAPVVTLTVPVAGDETDPTEGDTVVGLDNKVSCLQRGTDLCIYRQSDSDDLSSMEEICENSDSGSGLQDGNQCADLDITAKCNIEIKGDRFTIYNIGGLSVAKEDALAGQCAGIKVDGKVFKGTYVTLTDHYVQNLKSFGEILEIITKVFKGIFGFLAQIFGK